MRKIITLLTATIIVLSSASAALAGEIRATGGYSALADEDGNGTSFLSGGLRYEADRFLAGGSYAMDLDYNPAPPLNNSDDLFLLYAGPRVLDLGVLRLSMIGGHYRWANQVTENLFTRATLRTEMNSTALGLQASAAWVPSARNCSTSRVCEIRSSASWSVMTWTRPGWN